MTDEKGPDEKIILVPLRDPAWMRVHDIHDIPPEFRDEIEHFFQVYKDLEEAKTETRGFGTARRRSRGSRRRAGAHARRPFGRRASWDEPGPDASASIAASACDALFTHLRGDRPPTRS